MELKFTKVRKVKSPLRAHPSDAGVDFYVPEANNEFINDFVNKNIGHSYELFAKYYYNNEYMVEVRMPVSKYDVAEDLYDLYDNMWSKAKSEFYDVCDVVNMTFDEKLMSVNLFTIIIAPHDRILVPSGIKTYIEPENSALIATNKSGVATKKGVVVGATTVDSHYSGEVHLSVINTNNTTVEVECDNKLVQFIHTPVYLSAPTEVTNDEYNDLTNNFDRGAGGFGSTGVI